MKLRIIILVLVLLSFLSTFLGGLLYYISIRKAALEKAQIEDSRIVEDIANLIDLTINKHKACVKTLAELDEIQVPLRNKDAVTLAKANSILDLFKYSFNFSVGYLMDSNGNTIASSNRNAYESFLGNNYSFRPYFGEAISGLPSTYMALGITSKERGIYMSHPVYGKDQTSISGVVVVKASIESIENYLEQPFEGIMLLTDPHGLVFASSEKEWLYNMLWEPSSEELSDIDKSQQFGKGPWNWTGLKKEDPDHVVDKSGKKYHLHSKAINNYPGWNITYLHDHEEVSRKIAMPLLRSTAYTILPLLILISFATYFLYRRASDDIIQRKKAEESLKDNEKKLHTLSITDELTGLYNRRGFFTLAEQHLKQSMRDKKENFLIVIDFDGLKFINDNFGHNEGDMVLLKTANILKESYRESDIIARIGGDEFIVLANETPETNIETITARLKDNINTFNSCKSSNHEISLSIGMIHCSYEQVCDLEHLIAKADKSMYEQKRKKQYPK